jgi:hypothetical protein
MLRNTKEHREAQLLGLWNTSGRTVHESKEYEEVIESKAECRRHKNLPKK